ncbi:ADP-ribosylglycohydrolase family protein [Flammeovirga sp. MY04]|uniref:ADP-ribosylglycohydrolase family protein n=1 Tax=Flammeovirga sp. MY04 TaxID=1191459 RepID=UPI0008063DB5|nr:ADP-ribosylglycohydrolase family protein [Flammeovirga sp. MY04]ANQ52603.1 ADP-ribosylglycohydrolase family protein [Flammeovirga sp. MY04]
MLSKEEFYNKILGGWLGKCAGGILGAPIEGYKCFNDIELSDKLFETNFPNDDLDLQILWLDMVAKKGPNVRRADYTWHWDNHVDFPWNEYGVATRNIKIGLDNPDTGKHNNPYWNESMGSPIRSEIWGMLCAGNPEKAAFYAKMDSQVDHHGFSDDAEAYFSAAAAIAFTNSDTNAILKEALNYISKDSLMFDLVNKVMYWHATFEKEVVTGKIKSVYGDADFTSAPMNIAYTILALVEAQGDFDHCIEALHYGHDSDCIVATAGALIGIIRGADEIPALWKKRIGNALVVSPEITGIDCPDTISDLTEKTVQAAKLFQFENQIVDFSEVETLEVKHQPTFALHTEVTIFPNFEKQTNGTVEVVIENFEEVTKTYFVELTSDYYDPQNASIIDVPPSSIAKVELPLNLNGKKVEGVISVGYTIKINKEFEFQKGIPFYGQWRMFGPFIQDDASLAPMNVKYPDHGLPSMPSATYMNHDLQCAKQEYLSQDYFKNLSEMDLNAQPFEVKTITPSAMTVDLSQYFYGKGERSLYLQTTVNTKEAIKKWLCFGNSNFITVWLNGEEIFKNSKQMRRWPSTFYTELNLKEGENLIVMRLDVINDDFVLDIGMKDHNERHPHQTQWAVDLNFSTHSVKEELLEV